MTLATGELELATDIVCRVAAEQFGVDRGRLAGTRGDETLATARQVAMYCIRCVTDLSYPQIGRLFNRNHSTVMHACRRIGEVVDEAAGADAISRAVVACFEAVATAKEGAGSAIDR